MSKIEEALVQLKDALVEEATALVERVKGAAEQLVEQFNEHVESLTEGAAPIADPLPTPEQNDAIKALRIAGKTDEDIAGFLGISIRTVKMAI